jgi:hypothetical protein
MNYVTRNTVRTILTACALAGAGSLSLHAQPKPKVVLPPSVEGDWVRTDEIGVGSYGGFENKWPKASLTPAGVALANSFPKATFFADISKKVGNAYVVRPHPCVFTGGNGGLEYNSAGFHAVVSKKEVLLVGEGVGNGRHIYLDNRPLPAPGTRTPTATGYSVGHIEPDGTLVVETTDLPRAMVTGDGVRTPESVVEQRFEPSADGTKLKIVYTWNDPKLYAKPHSYTYTFERMAPDATAYDQFCDATDPLESQSIVPPEQK